MPSQRALQLLRDGGNTYIPDRWIEYGHTHVPCVYVGENEKLSMSMFTPSFFIVHLAIYPSSIHSSNQTHISIPFHPLHSVSGKTRVGIFINRGRVVKLSISRKRRKEGITF